MYGSTPMSKFAAQIRAFGWTRAVALAAIALVALYRLAPHPQNVAPIGAMFVLGGLYLQGRGWGWLAAPFVALLVSDTVQNLAFDGRPFHPERIADYFAFALIALGAHLAGRRGFGWRLGAVVVSPLAFFLISNLGVWLTGGSLPNTPAYAHTLAGLGECYAAALPFFRGTLFGDWLFAGAGMLVLEGLRRREAAPRMAVA